MSARTNAGSPFGKASAATYQDVVRLGRTMLAAASRFIERARDRGVRSFVVYLAKPADELATLTREDQRALAAVLDRGDVLLSAGNTRFAALVKCLTRSTWSHVSMYVGPLDDASDPLCIVEADAAGGVRPIRLSQLDAHRVCVLRPNKLDDTERRRLADSVVSRIGSEYDVQLAWMLTRSLLVRPWGARLRSSLTTKGKATRFICSSLIAHAFALIGHSILSSEPPRGRAEVADHAYLIPADFERASAFEIVWRAEISAEPS